MKADRTASYTLSSKSHMDTYGYIYTDSFDPFNSSLNLFSSDGNSCSYGQFRLTVNLQADAVYILVVTTHDPSVTGVYSIIGTGPTKISLKSFSEYRPSRK